MKLKSIAALYTSSPEWYELAPNSRIVYLRGIRYLAIFMDMDADDITRPMIIKFKDDMYEKPATCRIGLITLNNILRYGYDRGLCNHNHASTMRHMPKTKPIPRWTDAECEKFDAAAPLHIRAAFRLALYTGQRKSDLIRMQWEQYDGKYIRVLQQKTKRVLRIPVHPILKATLDEMKEKGPFIRMGRRKRVQSPYILYNFYGDPWTLPSLQYSVKELCRKIGIENRTFHGLRKTTAAKLAEAGCSPHLIGSITGHRSLSELMSYTDGADQMKMAEEAIARWANE